MDEYEYKLKTNNVIIVAQCISKLVQTIATKMTQRATNNRPPSDNNAELLFLREKCRDERAPISLTACNAIVYLVERQLLDPSEELSYFISGLSTAKNFDGITQSVVSLLCHDMLHQIHTTDRYVCNFNVINPQHPLVTILRQNSNIWMNMFNQIQSLCRHNDACIRDNSVTLLRAVIFYVLCSHTTSNEMKSDTWKLLISLSARNDVACLLIDLVPVMHVSDLREKALMFKDLIEIAALHCDWSLIDGTLAYLTELVRQLIVHNSDPRPFIITHAQVIVRVTHLHSANVILLICADILTVCPMVYLNDIVDLCAMCIDKHTNDIKEVVKYILIASLLPWLTYPSCLVTVTLRAIDKIIKKLVDSSCDTKNERKHEPLTNADNIWQNKWFQTVRHNLSKYVHTQKLLESFEIGDNSVESTVTPLTNWLDNLLKIQANPNSNDSGSGSILRNFPALIFGIFLSPFSSSIEIKKSCELLLRIVTIDKNQSTHVLTLLIYRLARGDLSPGDKLTLIRALPKMAVLKENIALIVFTIEQMRNNQSAILQAQCLELYVSLWQTEVRCYPYLQKALLEPVKQREYDIKFDLVKALALKQICLSKPHQYGQELVGHLSKILNRCVDRSGEHASQVALDSIALLCKERVVDLCSTWCALEKLIYDKRAKVLTSLCTLLALFPQLAPKKPAESEYGDKIDNATVVLWSLTKHESDDVKKSALNALKYFSLEAMSLKLVPREFKVNIKVPTQYSKAQGSENSNESPNPDDVLPYIPGECWIEMLLVSPAPIQPHVSELLISWTINEINEYRRGIYDPPGQARGEPATYSYLPHKSIIKALVSFVVERIKIINDLSDTDTRTMHECLRVLSHVYLKPLPPLTWDFLLDLLHANDNFKLQALTIVARQSLISGSALRICENYLNNFEFDERNTSEILAIFDSMQFLAQTIPASALKVVLKKTLNHAMVRYRDNELDCEIYFTRIMTGLKVALLNDAITDANRDVIATELEAIFERVPSELFHAYCGCLSEVPMKFIERISSPNTWWSVTCDRFRRAVEFRALLALKCELADALVWLNEFIDHAVERSDLQVIVLRQVMEVVSAKNSDPSSSTTQWYVQLMGRIQTLLNDDVTQVQVDYLSDLFMLVTIALSEYMCFVADRDVVSKLGDLKCEIFPGAMQRLITLPMWVGLANQIAEFVYCMGNNRKLTEVNQLIYKQCLIQANFRVNSMKYLSIIIQNES